MTNRLALDAERDHSSRIKFPVHFATSAVDENVQAYDENLFSLLSSDVPISDNIIHSRVSTDDDLFSLDNLPGCPPPEAANASSPRHILMASKQQDDCHAQYAQCINPLAIYPSVPNSADMLSSEYATKASRIEPLPSPSPRTTRKSDGRNRKREAKRRRNHLEKNRRAANKHRKKMREYIHGLESWHEDQENRNNLLKAEVATLRQERLDLQEALFTHAGCLDEPIQNYISGEIIRAYANQSTTRAGEVVSCQS